MIDVITTNSLEFIRSDYVFLIALFLVTYASIKDIKYREIPDWVSIVLFVLAISIATSYSVRNILVFGVRNISVSGLKITYFFPLISLLIGFFTYLVIGVSLLYTGQWGGGDLKLFVSIGSLLGFNLLDFRSSILIDYILLLSVSAALYGIFTMTVISLRNWDVFSKGIKKIFANYKPILMSIIALTIFSIFLWGFSRVINSSSALNTKFFDTSVGIILTSWYLPVFMIFLLIALILVIISKTVEQYCLIVKLEVDKLTIGDWLAEDVVLKNKVIVKKTKPGLSERDIKRLKRFGVKHVLVKQGLPFIPSMWVALIALFFIIKADFSIMSWLSMLI